VSETVAESRMLDLPEKQRQVLSSFFFELEDSIRAGIINFGIFNDAVGIQDKLEALNPYFRYFDIYPREFRSMYSKVETDLKTGRAAKILGIDPDTMTIQDFVRYLEYILGFIDEDDTGEIDEL
jgi:hypothetical protein